MVPSDDTKKPDPRRLSASLFLQDRNLNLHCRQTDVRRKTKENPDHQKASYWKHLSITTLTTPGVGLSTNDTKAIPPTTPTCRAIQTTHLVRAYLRVLCHLQKCRRDWEFQITHKARPNPPSEHAEYTEQETRQIEESLRHSGGTSRREISDRSIAGTTVSVVSIRRINKS